MLKFTIGAGAFAAAIGLIAAGAARSAPGDDWVAYGHDGGAQRYSPLSQITPANVAGLKVAWTFHMKPQPAARALPSQMTPLVVGGVMYLGTPYGRIVALDGAGGKEICCIHDGYADLQHTK